MEKKLENKLCIEDVSKVFREKKRHGDCAGKHQFLRGGK